MFQFPSHVPEEYRVYALVGGALLALSGWLIYRLGVRVAGFGLGALLGAALGYVIPLAFDRPEYQLYTTPLLAVLLGVASGIVVASLVRAVVFVCVTLIAFFGLVVLEQNWQMLRDLSHEPYYYVILAVASLFAGVLGTLLIRYLIIVLTAWMGASLMASVSPYAATFPVVFAIGLGVQLRLHRMFTPRRREKEPNE